MNTLRNMRITKCLPLGFKSSCSDYYSIMLHQVRIGFGFITAHKEAESQTIHSQMIPLSSQFYTTSFKQ